MYFIHWVYLRVALMCRLYHIANSTSHSIKNKLCALFYQSSSQRHIKYGSEKDLFLIRTTVLWEIDVLFVCCFCCCCWVFVFFLYFFVAEIIIHKRYENRFFHTREKMYNLDMKCYKLQGILRKLEHNV